MNDEVLVKKLLLGDKKALSVWYGKYQSKLRKYVELRVRDERDVEEIVADVFLGCLDSLPLFAGRSKLWTFMVAIARHEIADYWRRSYAKKAIKYVPFLDTIYTEPLYSMEETSRLFELAMKRISREERRLLIWKYDQKWSVKKIAQELGVGVKAAESKVFRARKAFVLAYEKVK